MSRISKYFKNRTKNPSLFKAFMYTVTLEKNMHLIESITMRLLVCVLCRIKRSSSANANTSHIRERPYRKKLRFFCARLQRCTPERNVSWVQAQSGCFSLRILTLTTLSNMSNFNITRTRRWLLAENANEYSYEMQSAAVLQIEGLGARSKHFHIINF